MVYGGKGEEEDSYWQNGERHRDDGPAVIELEADGGVSEGYLRDGKWHREDGPPYIRYSADGSVMLERYSRDGKRHREDGPVDITYRAGGNVGRERYYQNGKLHREGGPAEDRAPRRRHCDREVLARWRSNMKYSPTSARGETSNDIRLRRV